MEFNQVIFPAPPSSYSEQDLDGLVWVPILQYHQERRSKGSILELFCASTSREAEIDAKDSQEEYEWIPSLYLRYNEGATKLLIYFHGNAEDIGLAYDFLNTLKMELRVHIIAMEYKGYGIYKGVPDAESINRDALGLYDYILKELKWPDKDIIIFGRSIGSGPATYVSARRNPGCLILMTPFTSLRAVVHDYAGYLASLIVRERFRNVDEIKFVMCPTLLIHGKSDELIPFRHSIELKENCRGACYINLQEGMTHNLFHIFDDLIAPISVFFLLVGFKLCSNLETKYPHFPNPEKLKNVANWKTLIKKHNKPPNAMKLMKLTQDE